MIKYVIVIVSVWTSVAAAGLVSNTGSSSEDSVSCSVWSLDSLGNPTPADSFLVAVTGPSGDSVFGEAIVASSARIDSLVLADRVVYTYRAAVADIDGSGSPGVYTLNILAVQNALSLSTPNTCEFQVVRTGSVSDVNICSISQDSVAADRFETMLDGSGGTTLSLGRLAISGDNGGGGSFTVTNTSGPGMRVIGLAGFGLDVQGSTADISADLLGDVHGVITPADTNASGEQIAVMPPHWTADDSAAYGGTASVDSAALARAVWNAPAGNHSVIGSFGSFLDAPVSSVTPGGSGAYTITLTAFDSVNQQSVPGVCLAVRSLDQQYLWAAARTGVDGSVGVNLESDSFLVIATATAYSFVPYDTLVVFADAVDTVFGTWLDPGTPTSPSLCRVYGYLVDVTGLPESGVDVEAHLPRGVTRTDGRVISPYPVTTQTDATGLFCLDLIPSEIMVGEDPRYEISIHRADGTILKRRVSVPDAAMWQLTW
ncbi:MAG: hypothetical protein KKA42_03655 [candidate division Zixibacteria bacterium]|nr:hypothetical protein [candidate division Zixibacteria bacterium]